MNLPVAGILFAAFFLSPTPRIGVCLALAIKDQQSAHAIRSPSLPIVGGKHIVLDAVPGWRVSRCDDRERWRSVEYDMEFAAPKRSVALSILQYPLSRARRHHDLIGKPFMTSHGLRGLLSNDGDEFRYVVAVPSTTSVLEFVFTENGVAREERQPVAESFLQSLSVR